MEKTPQRRRRWPLGYGPDEVPPGETRISKYATPAPIQPYCFINVGDAGLVLEEVTVDDQPHAKLSAIGRGQTVEKFCEEVNKLRDADSETIDGVEKLERGAVLGFRVSNPGEELKRFAMTVLGHFSVDDLPRWP